MKVVYLYKLETSKIKISKTSRARIICTPEYLSVSSCTHEWLRRAGGGDIELKRGLRDTATVQY